MSNNNGFLPLPKGLSTIAIHEGQDPDKRTNREVVIPISMTTTYKQEAPGNYKEYEYIRHGNPTRDALEKIIAKMECAKHAACFSSGLGAISSLLTLLKHGDHFVCIEDIYGGTNRLFLEIASNFGIEVTFAENNVDAFEKCIRPSTKMIFVESPTNPTLQVVDLEEMGKLAKRRNLMFVVDNTFLTPFFQRPISFGADVVVHSLSKYMNGHSDVCMGALVTNDDKLGEKFHFFQKAIGAVPSPFDCYQIIRSLKTLPLRMKQHFKNGLAVAEYLEKHPKIEKVMHPALPSHPQHELAKRQSSGHSGILSFYLKGDMGASTKFLNSLKYFTLAPSLGGAESLAALNVLMTHSWVPEQQRKKLGITDNLIRLSVGLEDEEDLIADLEQALNNV
ncbi:putative cystathionine gamma-lyase 2 [Coccinella septempunctata]|uniref:putative cystathionine gamma-lyase 2 n=1 Tax=Coccinella septempunctata TaxID=41139 RepID=UPI001D0754B4|nr:putative cystathionine gamma-lyase 2 [Coccinella septempunctata]